jgi:hypothetical protein
MNMQRFISLSLSARMRLRRIFNGERLGYRRKEAENAVAKLGGGFEYWFPRS